MKKLALMEYYRAIMSTAVTREDIKRAKQKFKAQIKETNPICVCGETMERIDGYLICWRCYNQDE